MCARPGLIWTPARALPSTSTFYQPSLLQPSLLLSSSSPASTLSLSGPWICQSCAQNALPLRCPSLLQISKQSLPPWGDFCNQYVALFFIFSYQSTYHQQMYVVLFIFLSFFPDENVSFVRTGIFLIIITYIVPKM